MSSDGAAVAPPLRLTRLAGWLGLDWAVGFTLLSRAWSALAGPATVALLSTHLTAAEQGYYYTFNGLAGLTVFVELGLGLVLIQFYSHEFGRLGWADGRLVGDPAAKARAAGLFRQSVRLYAVLAVVTLPFLGVAGRLTFGPTEAAGGVAWRGPWAIICAAVAANLALMPLVSLLNGCGQVKGSARAGLASGVFGSVVLWAGLVGGLGLYAAPLSTVVTTVALGAWVAAVGRRAVSDLYRHYGPARVSWAAEVWPFQWRVAVSWLSGYFAFYGIAPAVFAARGPVEAGRVGMTLSLSFSVGLVAAAWFNVRMPQAGVLAGAGRLSDLDRLFVRTGAQAGGLVAVAATALTTVVAWLSAAGHPAADRVLPPGPFGLVMLATLAGTILYAQTCYLRAFKREPLMLVNLGVGVGVFGASYLLAGVSPWATAAAVFCPYLALGLVPGTWVFWRERRLLGRELVEGVPCRP